MSELDNLIEAWVTLARQETEKQVPKIVKEFIPKVKERRVKQIRECLTRYDREPMIKHLAAGPQAIKIVPSIKPKGANGIQINFDVWSDPAGIEPFEENDRYRRLHGFNIPSQVFVGKLVYDYGITQLPYYATVWDATHEKPFEGLGWKDSKNTKYARYLMLDSLNTQLSQLNKDGFDEELLEMRDRIGEVFMREFNKLKNGRQGGES